MIVDEQGVGVRLSRRAVEGGEVNILFGHVNLMWSIFVASNA